MEDEEMQTGGLGGQSPSVNLGTLATERAFAAQTDILKQQQALAKKRYEEGRQRIEQMRLGPTRSEQLMAISQALLSPSPYRNRFKGTLANLSQVAGPMVGANRRAELEKAEMLRQLTEQYEDRALASQKTAADLAVERAKTVAGKPTFSEGEGMFVNPQIPTATSRKYETDLANGGTITLTQFTDGTLRSDPIDGVIYVYDLAMQPKGTIPAKGGR
jgi:hypothetical protein